MLNHEEELPHTTEVFSSGEAILPIVDTNDEVNPTKSSNNNNNIIYEQLHNLVLKQSHFTLQDLLKQLSGSSSTSTSFPITSSGTHFIPLMKGFVEYHLAQQLKRKQTTIHHKHLDPQQPPPATPDAIFLTTHSAELQPLVSHNHTKKEIEYTAELLQSIYKFSKRPASSTNTSPTQSIPHNYYDQETGTQLPQDSMHSYSQYQPTKQSKFVPSYHQFQRKLLSEIQKDGQDGCVVCMYSTKNFPKSGTPHKDLIAGIARVFRGRSCLEFFDFDVVKLDTPLAPRHDGAVTFKEGGDAVEVEYAQKSEQGLKTLTTNHDPTNPPLFDDNNSLYIHHHNVKVVEVDHGLEKVQTLEEKILETFMKEQHDGDNNDMAEEKR